jgi:hypothetical protein
MIETSGRRAGFRIAGMYALQTKRLLSKVYVETKKLDQADVARS